MHPCWRPRLFKSTTDGMHWWRWIDHKINSTLTLEKNRQLPIRKPLIRYYHTSGYSYGYNWLLATSFMNLVIVFSNMIVWSYDPMTPWSDDPMILWSYDIQYSTGSCLLDMQDTALRYLHVRVHLFGSCGLPIYNSTYSRVQAPFFRPTECLSKGSPLLDGTADPRRFWALQWVETMVQEPFRSVSPRQKLRQNRAFSSTVAIQGSDKANSCHW